MQAVKSRRVFNDGKAPIYSPDNEYRGSIPFKKAEKLAAQGFVRLVRSRSKHIVRVMQRRRTVLRAGTRRIQGAEYP